jgi:DNA-binding XRE family transcriptional regulator
MAEIHVIRAHYGERDLTEARAELAALVGISAEYLRLVDSRHSRPSWDLCFKLEKHTGIPAKKIREEKLNRELAAEAATENATVEPDAA